jgi:hypothetical protein
MDDLFGSDEPADSAAASEEEAAGQSDEEAEPGSVDALFAEEPQKTAKAGDSAPSRLTAFSRTRSHTPTRPDHWSLARNTLELSLDGRGERCGLEGFGPCGV